ncbi:MAG: phospholipase D-like domain-containing protein [Ignavibacteriaceae bacterium]|nr:phospholipase D-like domain-containing protein [Ignavibacteriaceae bacterium]
MIYLKLFFLFIFTSISFSQIVPISEMRLNDANGVPVGVNQIFTIEGVVTSSNQLGVAGPATIQDLTGGMAIYGSPFVSLVNIGDSVTVTALLTNYNGLAELSATASGFMLVNRSSGNYFDTTIVTISQIVNQQWNGLEEFESRLIRINNVTISGTGSFSGNTNYNISDATGTLLQGLRIDTDVTTIVGSAIPTSPVDLIGVLGQHDYTAPFSTDYQILPRFVLDIIDDGSPLILNPVFAAGIDTSSFTVYFNTARNGNSQVKYGLTSALELDSVVINDDTTNHVVPVIGLQAGTLYYFKAYSTNLEGTSFSTLQSVSTASTDTSIGKINIYFNFSVDTTAAIPGNNAIGNVNFEQKLIERINAANYSIDLALYSFSDKPNIANALVVAQNRDVKIRVVYQNRLIQNSMQTLIDAGIPYIQRNASLYGIMHNKFFIFDARDSHQSNDWVWTGSWNVTALESTWKNNIVEVNDPTLAYAYTIEFQEMWGDTSDIPNISLAKFGSLKSDNTQHFFNIGGRDVQLYFSPSDGTNSKIINAVNTTNKNIYFAQYTFTRSDIEYAIHQKFNSGVSDIRGIIEEDTDPYTQYNNLALYAEMYPANGNTQHHKYAIFDATEFSSDPITIAGSHNWSNAAEENNDENTLVIHDIYIANQFMQEFKKRYNEAGGTGIFVIPVTDVEDYGITEFNYSLHQNYPNPFNPVTTIRFEVPYSQKVELKVFDILGREVRELYNDIAPAGVIAIDFKADDLASGVYIYRLKAENFIDTKKLLLLK